MKRISGYRCIPAFSISYFLTYLLLVILTLSTDTVIAEIDAETGKECVDFHENCSFWASSGECEKNPKYMRTNCRKSCDRCK